MKTNKVLVGLVALNSVLLILVLYYVATIDSSPTIIKTGGGSDSNAAANYSSIPGNNAAQAGMNAVNNNLNAAANNPLATNNPTLNATPNANSNIPTGPTTNIKFASDFKDFGTVKAQSENTYSFEFVNTGTEPLNIENAKGSCGCTVPDWPKKPIMPGEKGTIDVVFRPKNRESKGEDKKTVTVTANTNPKATVLTVRAMVEP